MEGIEEGRMDDSWQDDRESEGRKKEGGKERSNRGRLEERRRVGREDGRGHLALSSGLQLA